MQLGASEQRGMAARATNGEAYQAYLQGLYYLHQRGPAILRSIDQFQRAIAADSMFAPAVAGLSEATRIGSCRQES